jgi:hypothetical protein
MPSYISSNENRFYAAVEPAYGTVASITSANRLPAVKLTMRQQLERYQRKDKTGSRTFAGVPAGMRRRTSFEMQTYLTGWTDQSQAPGYGPLFQAALGSSGTLFSGGALASNSDGRSLSFVGAHGLSVGQAVGFGGEIRFVAALVDNQTAMLNAPFTVQPSAGSPMAATMTYRPATELPSVSVFDYWSPATAVQRVLSGAAVDKLKISVNGDFHEFTFSGLAADVVDSSSFGSGQGQLQAFPPEPVLAAFDYSIVPGHLGQVWMGNAPDQLFTLTSAELTLENGVALRNKEFGSELPRGMAGGVRTASLDFSLFEQNDSATSALYQAARSQSPISVMFQLGQNEGQLFGAYFKSVIPEVPQFDDSDTRLQWSFQSCRAQGTIDDEIFIAFG